MSNTSIETLWRDDNARRKRLIKLIALTVVVLAGMLTSCWAYVTQPLLSTPSTQTVPKVDPARLEAHVRALSQTFFPRDYGHSENLEIAANYIREEFEKAKAAAVSEQPFQVGGKNYRNVTATFGPETVERIVVGAHYDSFGPNPAADDNASGVAGLIELSYLFGNNPPPMRVELVAYTLEEPPFFRTASMGSAVHAASLRSRGMKVRTMFSLEMIGYFSDAPNTQHFPAAIFGLMYPSTGNFIAVVGSVGEGMLVRRVKAAMRAATPLPVHSINAPVFIAGVDFSDHVNYWDAGYPAVMVTDTAFYRNEAYHTVADTADRLDYRRMAMVVEGVYSAVLALASSD